MWRMWRMCDLWHHDIVLMFEWSNKDNKKNVFAGRINWNTTHTHTHEITFARGSRKTFAISRHQISSRAHVTRVLTTHSILNQQSHLGKVRRVSFNFGTKSVPFLGRREQKKCVTCTFLWNSNDLLYCSTGTDNKTLHTRSRNEST